MISLRSFLFRYLPVGLVVALGPHWLAGQSAIAVASDLDFAKSELSRVGRSSMTNDQRKAMNLVDRYRQFRATEKRKSVSSPPVAAPATSAPPSTSESDVSPTAVPTQFSGGTYTANWGATTFALTPADCTEMLAPISEKTLRKEAIERIQRQLTKLALYHFSVDGLVGSRTRIALRNFCESSRFALADDLQVMLRTHLAISGAHPNWVDTLASQDFARWARTQADFLDIDRVRHLGDAKAVINLIERFENRGARRKTSAVEDYSVSYALTKDDLQQLKSAKEITTRIQDLEAGKYASAREFDAGLEKAFKGVANPERFISLVRDYAEVTTSLSLTEQSFRRLKVKNVAPHILSAMETLRGLSYPDTEIAGAVEQVVVGLQNGLKGFKPDDLVGLAEITTAGGRFTRESMKKFEATYDAANPMAPAVGIRIRAMMEFVYQDKNSMTLAMRNVLRQLLEEINQVAPVIVAEAEEVTEYRFDDEAIAEIVERIGSLLVPEVYVDFLTGMEATDYPNPDLFWLATKSRFSIGDADNTIREAILKSVRRERVTRIDEGFLGHLREQKVPASFVAQMGALKDREFNSAQALEVAIDEVFVKLEANYEQFRPIVVAQAKKIHRFDKSKSVKWSGGGCNCSNPALSGDVYGIYPHWLAGETQEIDFSLTSRIGYLGLSFDDFGNIQDAARWPGVDPKFIPVAQAYNVGIDLVLTKHDWRGWREMGPPEKTAAVDALVDNISGVVTQRLPDFFSRIKPYISLGLSSTPTIANGVTLYIDNYPDDEDSIETFDLLIRRLSDRLQTDGERFNINLMFSSSQLGRGIFQANRLSRTLETIVSHSRLKARFLVLLQEPTEDDRAQVRARIEQNLEGRQRLDLLRSVIMVFTSDGRNRHRLSDNVTFAEDNFGGIGFWTQPTNASGVGADNLFSKVIKESYLARQSGLSIRHTGFCSVICPNRWWFRIAWGLFMLAMIIATVVYFYSCNYRVFLERHFVWLVVGVAVPMFLVMMTLLSCDPGWAEISRGNDLLVLVVMGVVAYALWNYRKRKELVDLP